MTYTPLASTPTPTSVPEHRKRRGLLTGACFLAFLATVGVVLTAIDGDGAPLRGDGPINEPAGTVGLGAMCRSMTPGRTTWLNGMIGLQNDAGNEVKIESMDVVGATPGFEVIGTHLGHAGEYTEGVCMPSAEFSPLGVEEFGPILPGTQIIVMIEGGLSDGHPAAAIDGFSVTYTDGPHRYIEEFGAAIVFCAAESPDDPECTELWGEAQGRADELR